MLASKSRVRHVESESTSRRAKGGVDTQSSGARSDDDQLICGHGRDVGMLGRVFLGSIGCGGGQELAGGHGRG